jgi:hypothetical protein
MRKLFRNFVRQPPFFDSSQMQPYFTVCAESEEGLVLHSPVGVARIALYAFLRHRNPEA